MVVNKLNGINADRSTVDRQDAHNVKRKKAGFRQWLYCILACIACIAFVIWTGYWGALLLILLFIDIYITKFIPWGGWRNVKNKYLRTLFDWIDAIVFALVGVWFITTFFFQNYQIPTSSLEKSLLVGDFLCVSKMSYGTRSPMTPLSLPLTLHTIPGINCKSYLDKPQLKYERFKSGGKVKRYDIVVFNYPAGDTVPLKVSNPDYYILCEEYKRAGYGGRDYILNNKDKFGEIVYRPVDRRENYVKRCVGLPGETISLVDDTTYIDGKPLPNPENMQLKYVVQTTDMISDKVWDDLGISLEDRVFETQNVVYDSLECKELGLKYTGDSPKTYLYKNVFMDAGMKSKLLKKPFILAIVKQNLFNKHLRRIDGVAAKDYYTYAVPYVYPSDYRAYCEAGDFPATWIPKRGETIKFDRDVDYKVAAYRRCIVNYEGNTLDYKKGKVYINGKLADSYTFKFDYFFMMGDNRDNSMDSRAWGFVPEDHVVGKPLFIWLSLDKDKGWFSGKIRWNRIFTNGNKNK